MAGKEENAGVFYPMKRNLNVLSNIWYVVCKCCQRLGKQGYVTDTGFENNGYFPYS